MSDNLNEDLQKFEDIERLLEDDAEVKSDEVEAEDTEEETEESSEVESGDDDAVTEEDDSEEEGEAEAEEDSSDDDEGEDAEAESDDSEESSEEEAEVVEEDAEEEVDVIEKVANALEAQTKDAEDDEDGAEEVEEAEEAEESEESEEDDAEESDEEESEEAEESDEDESEEKSEADEISEKAASIMARMVEEESATDMPVLWFKESDLAMAEEDYEIIPEAKYHDLDDDAKDAYEAVQVFEEGTGKGYGMRYRRRSPLERDSRRKDDEVVEVAEDGEEKADMPKDMFGTAAEAVSRAAEIGCEGSHQHSDGMFMPCATMEAYQAAVGGEKSEDFLCGQQRKSVQQPCDVCRGGCAPEDGLPGLSDIEAMVKSAYEGSEVIGSGYSNVDDMFLVDIKRADGTAIEVFLSGDGEELGWLRLDDAIGEKSLEGIEVVSKDDAEKVAISALEGLEVKGEVMGVMVDIFADEDVYVVEIDSEEKSYDFFVSIDGKVLGYDEYEVEAETELTEEEEIKALEAELEIKRMYSREQRESMAESGEALPDGSFPIADEADLENALAALPRAKDKAEAAAHIIKRASELGLEDALPAEVAEMASAAGEAAEEASDNEEDGDEKAAPDSELISALEEFQSMKLEEGLS